MPHTGAVPHSFSQPDAASRHIVEHGQALLRLVFLAAVGIWGRIRARPRIVQYDEYPVTEMSDQRLQDLGIARSDIQRGDVGRFEPYPHW